MSDLNTYLNVGAGGLALITLVFLIKHIVTKLVPAVNKLNETCAVNDKVLENNTLALNNNSQATVAVAKAIEILNNSVVNQNDLLQKVYNKSSIIENHVVNLDGYVRGRQDADKDGRLRHVQ